MIIKKTIIALVALALSGCAAKQAENLNVATNPSGGTGTNGTQQTGSSYLSFSFSDGANQNVQSVQEIANQVLSQKPAVIIQLASVACDPCRDEATAIRQYIQNEGLSSQIEHILAFVDVADPNSINQSLIRSAHDQFINEAGSEDVKYVSGTYPEDTYYTYVFSRSGNQQVEHDAANVINTVIGLAQSAISGN